MNTILETKGLVKRFGQFVANQNINLTVNNGEIHAILGENGAGKSTLMNMLSGLLTPDEGEIIYKGDSVKIQSPKKAMELGIGMVHQHFMLIPAFTVAENVMLGLKQSKGPLYDHQKACDDIRTISKEYGLDVDPTKKVNELSIGEQQRVEILKTLYRGAEFIIMDEPTAVLTPHEVQELFEVLRSLKKQGKTIIFISHKLQEIESICDRVSVLRMGMHIATLSMKDTNPKKLAQMMVGRELHSPDRHTSTILEKIVLDIKGVTATEDQKDVIQNVSLQVHEGEIVGIAGVDGNGQRELSEVIFGLRDKRSGSIHINGDELIKPNPRKLTNLGVGYIPEDRHQEGLILSMSVEENFIAKSYNTLPFSRGGILSKRTIKQNAVNLIQQFKIKAQSPIHPVSQLSGGNQQKVIFARELMLNPKVLVAMQPTRGMDVGASEYVHQRLLDERDKGCGILLISTELEEILLLSDRIAVMYEGQILGIFTRETINLDHLSLLMAGVKSPSTEVI
ncbi:MAG: ABC transporter ATP-binding protein [Bacillota bacterium]